MACAVVITPFLFDLTPSTGQEESAGGNRQEEETDRGGEVTTSVHQGALERQHNISS